jgi:Carboxypeptidase regulatory-like domain
MSLDSKRVRGSARLFWFAWLSVILIAPGFSQETASTGKIEGSVTSKEGQKIAGARVVITNRASKQAIATTTNSEGAYITVELPPGDYTVRVDARGVESPVVPVTVQAGISAKADVRVLPSVVEVNTERATIDGALRSEQIENLPFDGRNFLDFGLLEPGIQNQDGNTFDPSKSGTLSISIGSRNGREPRTQVDGMDISDETVGGQVSSVPASAIQEFRVTQSLPDLATDMASSGIVNIVTKSGTNDIHGEAFGFYRNGDIASASLPGENNHDWAQQQFGGDLGGALIKDKLFWFVDGERNRRDLQNPVLAGFPFTARSTKISEPFRQVETTGRLDYLFSKTTHAFYRFNYDQSSDVRPLGSGPSMQPVLSRTNTPAHSLGLDFTTGNYLHSFRFEYLKYRNVISDASSQVFLPGSALPNITINIGGGATNQCSSGSLFCSGPSYLAPQQTFQSDTQFRYDGSNTWRSRHQVNYGVSFNRILAGGFANLYSLAPTLSDSSNVPLPLGVLTSNGDPTDPLNYPVEWAFIGNGQGFASEKSAFGLPGGGQQDNRFSAYLGDSWKVKPNLTVTYGVHWIRDSGRSDSDLAAVPQLDAWGTRLGRKVRQPNANFAPRLGVAWDPYNSRRTSIRGGIGLYYNNSVFQNVMLDRSLRLQSGSFLSTPAVCIGGAPGQIVWPSIPGVVPGGVVNANGTVSPTWCGQNIGAAESQAVAFQAAYQAAAAVATSNPNFIGNANAFAGPNQNGLSLLAPDYQTPRSVQMNFGIQHELRPGLVFNADFLRNVTTRNLLGIDVNHGGGVGTFNLVNAITDRDNAQVANNCPTGAGQVGCMVSALGTAGALAAYGNAGIGGPAQVTGGAPCPFCAFPGFHPDLGVNVMNFPYGRSVFNAFDLSLKQQIVNFAPGIKHAYLQLAYSHSKYVSQSDDSGLASLAPDYFSPNRFTGPSDLDRKNQFSMGGYFDLPRSVRLGLLGHFASPLPVTLRLQQNAGAAEVLVTDWTGDGSTGDIVEGSNVGSYMRSIEPSGLRQFIDNYNQTLAGTLTPAGSTLQTAGVFAPGDLAKMGAVLQPLALTVQNPAGLSWVKTFDLRLTWQHTFMDRVTVEPSVGIFNLFNFANFDLPGYKQSGVLNYGAGSVSQPATALQPQGTVGGASTDASNPVTGRINRATLQSGMGAVGAPRALEWGLKIAF